MICEPGWLLRECESDLDKAQYSPEELRDYQTNILIPFLIANPKSAAYVGMGLGKTVSVLTVLDHVLAEGTVSRVLIVAPVRVAIQTWPTEISLWRHTRWMRYSVIRPDPFSPEVAQVMKAAKEKERRTSVFPSPNAAAMKAKTHLFYMQRMRAAQVDCPIHIVNREWFSALLEAFGSNFPYDCIIIDEATSFADHTSNRFKAMALVARKVKRLHLLSGTPAPEGIQQLFAQCYLMDAGERFGRHITPFRDSYMKQNIYTKKWEPLPGAIEAVSSLMAPIAMVMKEEEYLPMDKPLVIERPIVLEKHELKQYKEFERTMILSLPDDEEIEAVNAGVLSMKLLQYASGSVYDAERKVHIVHDHKIEDLKEFIEANPGEPIMVAYWFKPSLERLQKAFPKATTMDKDGACVEAWNAGKIPVLFVHPQSAGHGLNMQKGPGHILVYYDTPASLELYMQLIKRLARPGQKQLVRVVHLVAQGTLDKLAVPRLRNKEAAQDSIMYYLRELRRRYKKVKAA